MVGTPYTSSRPRTTSYACPVQAKAINTQSQGFVLESFRLCLITHVHIYVHLYDRIYCVYVTYTATCISCRI